MYSNKLPSEVIKQNQIITFYFNKKIIKSLKIDQHQ